MLLARELGMDDVISSNAKYLLSHGVLVKDTLQFLHTNFGGDASEVITVLDPNHLEVYLEWLMNWSMTEESLKVWHAMVEVAAPKRETSLRYANFLLHNKHIKESRDIWQKYTGVIGMTNPGFEEEITGRGYDWCYWKEKDRKYEIMRINHGAWEGDYALRVNFSGLENLSLYHLYQIFTADPQSLSNVYISISAEQ